ncbi:MAG: 5-(carboxyamino)imidazole ribonucleotide synthase [Elainellaceae cyanobacterium]
MGQRVGVVGGGQLAWMMGKAARDLGIELVVQTPKLTDPAVAVATDTVLGAIANAETTAQLAQHCEVITFENEFVDLDALNHLADQGVKFAPRLSALAPLLDKYHQRQFFKDLGVATPEFMAWGDRASTDISLPSSFDFPVVLKARRHGYDGQGTHILRSPDEFKAVLAQNSDVDWLLEAFVPFERELAVMAARFADGTVVVYPVVETQQENQVCCRVMMLPHVASEVVQQAEAIAQTVLNTLDVIGIFGFEFFLTADGRVLVNEIAPRTHNSGHYTLDACETSQFEQQLRAVCGLSPGSTQMRCPGAVMVNLLGFEMSQSNYEKQRMALGQIPHAHVYWYGKTESRPGRKLGHVTVLLYGEDPVQIRQNADAIAQKIESIWYDNRLN